MGILRLPVFALGLFLIPTKLIVIGQVQTLKRKIFGLFGLAEKKVVDQSDSQVINSGALAKLIIAEQITESLPQLCIQVVNNILLEQLDTFQIFKVSLSVYLAFSGSYSFLYYILYKKKNWDELPLGVMVSIANSKDEKDALNAVSSKLKSVFSFVKSSNDGSLEAGQVPADPSKKFLKFPLNELVQEKLINFNVVTFSSDLNKFKIGKDVQKLIRERTRKHWKNEDDFRSDFKLVFSNLTRIEREEHLLNALVSCLWLFLNIRCMQNFSESFLRLGQEFLEEFQNSKAKSGKGFTLSQYNEILSNLTKFIKEKNHLNINLENVTQKYDSSIDFEFEERHLQIFFAQAKLLQSMFRNLLLQIDERATISVNPGSNAMKSCKIFEYLSGMISIPIEASDSPKEIDRIFKTAISPIESLIVGIQFISGNEQDPEPSILLFLNFKELICQVRVNFEIHEVDKHFLQTNRMISRIRRNSKSKCRNFSELEFALVSELERMNFFIDFDIPRDSISLSIRMTRDTLIRMHWKSESFVITDRLYRIIPNSTSLSVFENCGK
jgi:hypothetical protein